MKAASSLHDGHPGSMGSIPGGPALALGAESAVVHGLRRPVGPMRGASVRRSGAERADCPAVLALAPASRNSLRARWALRSDKRDENDDERASREAQDLRSSAPQRRAVRWPPRAFAASPVVGDTLQEVLGILESARALSMLAHSATWPIGLAVCLGKTSDWQHLMLNRLRFPSSCASLPHPHAHYGPLFTRTTAPASRQA